MLKDFLPLEGGAGCCTVTSERLRIGFLQHRASRAFVCRVLTEQSCLAVAQGFGRYIKYFPDEFHQSHGTMLFRYRA